MTIKYGNFLSQLKDIHFPDKPGLGNFAWQCSVNMATEIYGGQEPIPPFKRPDNIQVWPWQLKIKCLTKNYGEYTAFTPPAPGTWDETAASPVNSGPFPDDIGKLSPVVFNTNNITKSIPNDKKKFPGAQPQFIQFGCFGPDAHFLNGHTSDTVGNLGGLGTNFTCFGTLENIPEGTYTFQVAIQSIGGFWTGQGRVFWFTGIAYDPAMNTLWHDISAAAAFDWKKGKTASQSYSDSGPSFMYNNTFDPSEPDRQFQGYQWHAGANTTLTFRCVFNHKLKKKSVKLTVDKPPKGINGWIQPFQDFS